MTVDEELSVLDDIMRRLKVEYDMYFGGGSKKPPNDLDWRAQSLIKKYSDSQKLTFTQRFKYNSIAQRYAIFSELWRQKLRIKEEGYRRPGEALLSVQGVRTEEERAAARALKLRPEAKPTGPQEFAIECIDAERDRDKIRQLYEAMIEAKRLAGETGSTGRFDGFLEFIKHKTSQLRQDLRCERVEYRIEVRENHVRLVARARG